MKLYIKRCETAKDLPLPKYMTHGAAGMDLYANVKETIEIAPNTFLSVPTGIAISMPDGYEAQIRPRSGLAAKFGVTMVNAPGTIDCDYRGEIHVILINFGPTPFKIERGDRIAQMVINKVELPELIELNELDETIRGEKGFGSTGL